MDSSNRQSRISTSYIPPHRTQLHPRLHSFSYPISKPPILSSPPHSHLKWWSLAAALFILPFLFYLLSVARGIHLSSKFSDSKPKGFGVIIHSSTDGTRIRIFEFLNEGPRIPFVGADGFGPNSMKIHPGLVEFAKDTENAGNSILDLLDFAQKRVPRAEWKDTKVWLVATGGLGNVAPKAREAILESCRRVLRLSGFMFRDEWASMVTGPEQGIYSWVAANYALGTLGGDPQETTGIIELGGTSLKVTFALRQPSPMEFSRIVKLAGVTYILYSRSMPHLGQDAAWELLLEQHKSRVLTSSSSSIEGIIRDPCTPRGYDQTAGPDIALNGSDKQAPSILSTGNFSACRSKALSLLQKGRDKCLHPPCGKVSSLMPELRGKHINAENFFYTSELFGLAHKASLLEIEASGRHYCQEDWARLKEEYHGIDDTDLLRYCFSSAFIVAFLHDDLGIPMDDKRVGFANQKGNAPLDWTLGAFIMQTVEEPEMDPDNLTRIIGNNTVTYLSMFAVLFFVIIAAFFVSQLRKPQLKTIYDLEKGHYIVTRVPR